MIKDGAFSRTSLQSIRIPRSAPEIHEKAFHLCSSLTSVFFCDEIEQFVSAESMRGWWSNGIHKRCIGTYCFLVRCNILERVGRLRSNIWLASIREMLTRIPLLLHRDVDCYFDSIESKLSVYEDLELDEVPKLLELAIWKSKITENFDGMTSTLTVDMKMQCRIESLSMVAIIGPNVFSFLTDSENGNYVFADSDGNSGNDDDDYDDSADDEEDNQSVDDEDENEDGWDEDVEDDGDFEHNR